MADFGRVTGSREPSPDGLGPSGFDPARCRLERYDSISHRILDGHGLVVALVLQLSNGRWIVTVNDMQCGKWSENSAKRAFIRWRDAIATEAQRAATVKQGAVHEGAGRRHRPDPVSKDQDHE